MRSVTGTDNATLTDNIILVSAAGAGWSLTLPAANTAAGKSYRIVKTDNNGTAITIDGNGAETINGAATYAGLSAQWKYLEIVCDGTQWLITGSN